MLTNPWTDSVTGERSNEGYIEIGSKELNCDFKRLEMKFLKTVEVREGSGLATGNFKKNKMR